MPRKEKVPNALLNDENFEFEIDKDQDIYAFSKNQLVQRKTEEKLVQQRVEDARTKVLNALDNLYAGLDLQDSKSVSKPWMKKSKYWIILQIDELHTWSDLIDFLTNMGLDFLIGEDD